MYVTMERDGDTSSGRRVMSSEKISCTKERRYDLWNLAMVEIIIGRKDPAVTSMEAGGPMVEDGGACTTRGGLVLGQKGRDRGQTKGDWANEGQTEGEEATA